MYEEDDNNYEGNKFGKFVANMSRHHLVAQPGGGRMGRDHNATRWRPKQQEAHNEKLGGMALNSPQEAMEDLRESHRQGIMACDWGCTQKVQSRGCSQHAQARWAR